ncbi:MAG: cytidylate kinase-like family protein [Ignavibacteria bacterium]|jgi:cytidylate kinase
MQIICISRHSYGYGKELAEELAAALGYEHISREELTDLAAMRGIPVGKLETAILKQQLIKEEYSNDIERFKALITFEICKRAKKNGVVYHGRVGHRVLQGLPNVLKIRAVAEEGERILRVVESLKLSRKQAQEYIRQVDEDRCRYAHFFYNIDCNDPYLFDIVVNSSHIKFENSIESLAQVAKSSSFQFNHATEQILDDLLLQAQCRLAIGEDERTRIAKVKINVSQGNVSVTYLPPFEKQAESIPSVLEKIPGIRSLVCTMAATTIMYIQEKFNPEVDSFKHLMEIAGKWNSAVDLVRLDHSVQDELIKEEQTASHAISEKEIDGGILDDIPESEEEEKDIFGMRKTNNKLIQVGRAGATHSVSGGIKQLSGFVRNSQGYCLLVVGDVFLSSSSTSQKRLKRELTNILSEHSRVPVISSDDLKEKYLFGPKQRIKMVIYALLTALIYFLIFSNQEFILQFVSTPGTMSKILAVAAIILFVPVAAYVISGFSSNIMKLVKLE